MVKFGIDWTKIALEVNDERKKIISAGARSADAFNMAYRAIMGQYPSITGEAWKEGRGFVGKIMAEWKKEKSRPDRAAQSPKKTGTKGKIKKRQGELDLF